MASLTQAVCVHFVEQRGDLNVYAGEVEKTWNFGPHPQGGYTLGLIVSSCISSQALTRHPEINHVTGHFLRTITIGYFEVHVQTVRIGRSYSNVSAELIQKNEAKISAQLIFGVPPQGKGLSHMTLLPPSPYARRVPLHMHPSAVQTTPMFSYAMFGPHVKWAEDKAIRERNRALGRGEVPSIGGPGLEWGAWIELLNPDEKLNAAVLPFMTDLLKSFPELLPKDQRPPPSWRPTMVLSIEYKAKIPDDPAISPRTVGLYACSRFMRDGRHDVYAEVWTSPAAIGEGVEDGDWRDRQVCLATAHQMALTVPVDPKASLAATKL